jgi:N-acylneuraminate cytidylyltransferase
MRLAVIPARGGSKRIPDKNIRPFLGKPIIAYSLSAACESGLFDMIHVSTESDKIRAVVEGLGYAVDFCRDPALADDHTGVMPVLEWVVRRYLDRGKAFRDVCLLMACAPMIEASDLVAAARSYELCGCQPLLAVASYPAPPQQALQRGPNGRLASERPDLFKRRSQDLEPMVYDSGTFLFISTERLLGGTPFEISECVAFDVGREKAVDVNDASDFDFVELLFLGRETRRRNPRVSP